MEFESGVVFLLPPGNQEGGHAFYLTHSHTLKPHPTTHTHIDSGAVGTFSPSLFPALASALTARTSLFSPLRLPHHHHTAPPPPLLHPLNRAGMSNIYHLEPPTKGKVVLHTSFGPVDIELWPREAPLACRYVFASFL